MKLSVRRLGALKPEEKEAMPVENVLKKETGSAMYRNKDNKDPKVQLHVEASQVER
jgi:hypothetical protein